MDIRQTTICNSRKIERLKSDRSTDGPGYCDNQQHYLILHLISNLQEKSLTHHRPHSIGIMLVVRGQLILNKLARAMRVNIINHVVALHLHIIAHLVEAGGADHVALAINLPCDMCVLGAYLFAFSISSDTSGVNVDVLAHFLVNDHATNHIRVEVELVVDDGEDLTVHANSARDVVRAKCHEDL
jgi:hypothetical protein